MDHKPRDDETWAKRFSSRALDRVHAQHMQSLPAFEVPSELNARLQTLLETLAQAEPRQDRQMTV